MHVCFVRSLAMEGDALVGEVSTRLAAATRPRRPAFALHSHAYDTSHCEPFRDVLSNSSRCNSLNEKGADGRMKRFIHWLAGWLAV